MQAQGLTKKQIGRTSLTPNPSDITVLMVLHSGGASISLIQYDAKLPKPHTLAATGVGLMSAFAEPELEERRRWKGDSPGLESIVDREICVGVGEMNKRSENVLSLPSGI